MNGLLILCVLVILLIVSIIIVAHQDRESSHDDPDTGNTAPSATELPIMTEPPAVQITPLPELPSTVPDSPIPAATAVPPEATVTDVPDLSEEQKGNFFENLIVLMPEGNP